VLSVADVELVEVEVVPSDVDVVLVEVDVVRFDFGAFEVDGADALSDPPHATAASATIITTDARRTRDRFRLVVMERP
jgi:hypothetical protein